MQEETKHYQKRPEASQIFKDTHLLASETLRPCAGSHGVGTQVVALEKRPCKDMAILGDFQPSEPMQEETKQYQKRPEA